MKEYWVYESSFSNLLNLLRERALTAARRNKFDEVIVELKESLLKEGKVFISPELADKIKKIIPDKYLQFVMEYDASYDDADADDGDGDSDNDNGAADTDADDGDGDGDGHADDGDADADDSDGDGGDEADVGADSGADDGNDGQSSKVGLAIVIVIAVAITFAMFIWYGVMAKKIITLPLRLLHRLLHPRRHLPQSPPRNLRRFLRRHLQSSLPLRELLLLRKLLRKPNLSRLSRLRRRFRYHNSGLW